MTKHDTHDKVKAPINPMGADCALLHKRRLAHHLNPYANPNRGEVVQMWKRRLFAALRFLVCFIGALWLLTTNAC